MHPMVMMEIEEEMAVHLQQLHFENWQIKCARMDRTADIRPIADEERSSTLRCCFRHPQKRASYRDPLATDVLVEFEDSVPEVGYVGRNHLRAVCHGHAKWLRNKIRKGEWR